MSIYEAKVIELTPDIIKKHDNADSLHVVQIGGYTCCIRSSDWFNLDGTLKHTKVVHIEPDTLIQTNREEFAFLKGSTGKVNEPTEIKVKAKKLRGTNSFGFLIPVGEDIRIDTDMWEVLGLKRWNPPEPSGDNSQSVKAPQRDFSQYDVENLKKYTKVFDGKTVVGTLKIHGQNMRVCNQNDQIYVGSRSFWKADSEGSDFWRSYRSVPGLEKLVKENSHFCIYGESYGNNSKYREDCPVGERRFRAFDIFDMTINRWLDFDEFKPLCERYDIPFCPIVYEGPFDIEKLLALVEQDSPLCKGQPSEGVVVCTRQEQWHEKLGRCKAKIVSCRYLEKGE